MQDAQNVLREEEIVGCLILEGKSSEEWRKEQLNDQIVSIFLQEKERNCRSNWRRLLLRGYLLKFIGLTGMR